MTRGAAGRHGGWVERTRLARIVAKRLEKMTGRRVRTVSAGSHARGWNDEMSRRLDESRLSNSRDKRTARAAQHTEPNWEPDTTYHVNNPDTQSNYVYQTDSKGRVVHAEGELILRKGHRNKAQQAYSGGGDRIYKNTNPRDNDAGGHLFGTQFGGAGEGLNMVPQAARQNSGGDWQAMERDWERALKADKDVYVKVVPKYPNDSTQRPHEFVISYTVRSVDANGRLVIENVRRTIPNP